MPKSFKAIVTIFVLSSLAIVVGVVGAFIEAQLDEAETEEDRLHRKQVNNLEATGKLATAKLVEGEGRGEGGYYELVFTSLPRRIPKSGQP